MQSILKDKVAIVTGATSGMGRAVARLYAQEGAKVIVGGRNVERGKKVADEINAAGGTARFYGSLDIAKRDTVEAMVKSTIDEFGCIDILAAFAGQPFDGDPGMPVEEVLAKTMNLNAAGTYWTVLAVIPHMKARKSGSIILCSSNGAFNPTAAAYEYHMAKGAIESLTVNLATDLSNKSIRVNCIQPGPIATEFWDELVPAGPARDGLFNAIAGKEVPLERMGTGDDIAGPALFLASDKLSGYITGLRLYVAGGMGYIYSHGQCALVEGHQGGIES
ncbi:MAG TPA: SDR family oxidoreductase [Anaerovoracaceae bacterium]|nr:SDR family oxidoreductase [Anaerovoracaceae bacterium]